MKYDIVTIGDATEDVFVQPALDVKYDRTFASGKGIVFEFGEKIPLNSVQYEIGGSACNAAVGLARLGYKTAIAGVVGDDTPKDKVIERLNTENVDQNSLTISKKVQTGFAVIFSIEGERTIFVYHSLRDYSDLKIKKNLKSKWFFVTPLGENTAEIEKRIIAEIAEHNSFFAWNPGSLQITQGASHFQHLLKCTSILFLNREETLKFTNSSLATRTEEAMKRLHHLGAKIVVVTNGKEGAKAYDGTEFYDIAADQRITRVDATGAGDAFASGFLGRLIDCDMKEKVDPDLIRSALKWGIKNSNSVIQSVGAQKGLLVKSQIEK
ncbi:MAG TPA: PfkB family carbohydrate kinase [Patescibacteria group bacterium]|nr:PfkB family carbohydrate kinase [Patescibacteria group bacterium]